MQSEYDLYLCYARRDGFVQAEQLYRDLTSFGLRVYPDPASDYSTLSITNLDPTIRASARILILLTPVAVSANNRMYQEWATAKALDKPITLLMGIDCLLPLPFKRESWIDMRANYAAALLTLRAALEGIVILPDDPPIAANITIQNSSLVGGIFNMGGTQNFFAPVNVSVTMQAAPVTSLIPVMWQSFREANLPPFPRLYAGRGELRDQFVAALRDLQGSGRGGRYLFGGEAGVGKTTLLQFVGRRAEALGIPTLYIDLSAEGAITSVPYAPVLNALNQWWAQLTECSAAVRRFQEGILDPIQIDSQLVWLAHALDAALKESPLVVLLDNLHLDQESLLLKWLAQTRRGGRILIVATQLANEMTPLNEVERWKVDRIEPFNARDLAAFFVDGSPVDEGARLYELTNGFPDVVWVVLETWEKMGAVTWGEDGFEINDPNALPDIWEALVEDALRSAVKLAGLADKYERDMLFDWLICAAVEGSTFTAVGLIGASAEDIEPDDSHTLLNAMLSAPHPILRRVPSTLPIETEFYQFMPPGLATLIRQNAYAEDVAYYGVRVFDVLKQATSPFTIFWHLRRIAERSLHYRIIELQEKGLSHVEIQDALNTSEQIERLALYQGYAERENKILSLRLRLSLISRQSHSERWSLLRELGLAMWHYSPNRKTAQVFRLARQHARHSQVPSEEIARLYYYEQDVTVDPAQRLNLMRAGWHSMPELSLHPFGNSDWEATWQFDPNILIAMAALFNGTGNIYSSTGENQRALEFYKQALVLCRTIDDQDGEASTLNSIGNVWSALGEKQQALEFYDQALSLCRVVGNQNGEATTLANVGNVRLALGEKWRALEFYNQALALHRAIGSRDGEATTLTDIGSAWLALGEKWRALEFYNQALALRRAVGNQGGEAITLTDIGNVQCALGEKWRALEFYNQALVLHCAVGSRDGEATTLTNIGNAWSALGERQRSLEFHDQALTLYRAVGNRSGEATTLTNIGNVRLALGEKRQALEFYDQALVLHRAVGSRDGEASTLNNIGKVWEEIGETQRTMEFYDQALFLHRAVGNRDNEASTLNNIGKVWEEKRETQRAMEFYDQALVLHRAVGDRDGEAITLANIGSIWQGQGDTQRAMEFYDQALVLHRVVNDRGGEATTLNNIGGVWLALEEKQRALEFHDQALALYRAIGDRDGEGYTYNNMAYIFESLGELDKAIEYAERSVALLAQIENARAKDARATWERLKRKRDEGSESSPATLG